MLLSAVPMQSFAAFDWLLPKVVKVEILDNTPISNKYVQYVTSDEEMPDSFNYNIGEELYKIYLSNQEIVNLLNAKNDFDELSCAFDFEKSIIRFSEYGSHRDYCFRVQECGDFSILRLEQVALVGMQSYVPYKLNTFIVSKLQAEIVSFSQYGF